ncbi:hypothetical protein FB107DRAFT_252195, partial [Schizophyllum commune]
MHLPEYHLVIGGGSRGSGFSRRVALYGTRVALVEMTDRGGTCVNVGCVPKKNSVFDWSAFIEQRDAYIHRLKHFYPTNRAKDGLGITLDGFFELKEQPKRAAAVGTGYISVEFAGIFNTLGSQTHLLLRGDIVFHTFNETIPTRWMEKMGVNAHCQTHFTRVEGTKDSSLTVCTEPLPRIGLPEGAGKSSAKASELPRPSAMVPLRWTWRIISACPKRATSRPFTTTSLPLSRHRRRLASRLADYVTLYVPEMSEMGREQFAQIKGVYLLNNAGGKVVNIPALINALKRTVIESRTATFLYSDVISSKPLSLFFPAERAPDDVVVFPLADGGVGKWRGWMVGSREGPWSSSGVVAVQDEWAVARYRTLALRACMRSPQCLQEHGGDHNVESVPLSGEEEGEPLQGSQGRRTQHARLFAEGGSIDRISASAETSSSTQGAIRQAVHGNKATSTSKRHVSPSAEAPSVKRRKRNTT